MLAVGNVGEELAAYTDSDIFITRDGGFSWEEIHKDAHMWEFGDSGSVIVIVNDEDVTDHVLYTTDEGMTWKSHNFGTTLRVQSIQTVPDDTSRRFLLIGFKMTEPEKSVLVHLDFSAITQRQCRSFRKKARCTVLTIQVSGFPKIQITTTLNYGHQAKAGMKRASLGDRRSTGERSEKRSVTSERGWISPSLLSVTVHVKLRTLNGESCRLPA